MTVGSRVLDAVPARGTATAILRLDQAGAVDLGPLNLNEMVAGPTGQNPHFGDCRNSVDPAHLRRLVQRFRQRRRRGPRLRIAGLGHGGSIRLPDSMSGLFALKPTYGRVSRAGCFPRAFSLDCVGPLARTAHDRALLLESGSGADAHDPSAAAAPVPPSSTSRIPMVSWPTRARRSNSGSPARAAFIRRRSSSPRRCSGRAKPTSSIRCGWWRRRAGTWPKAAPSRR